MTKTLASAIHFIQRLKSNKNIDTKQSNKGNNQNSKSKRQDYKIN